MDGGKENEFVFTVCLGINGQWDLGIFGKRISKSPLCYYFFRQIGAYVQFSIWIQITYLYWKIMWLSIKKVLPTFLF